MKTGLALVLILAALAPSVAAAQATGTLTGRVFDMQGRPVSGATIKVVGTSPLRGAIAKSDGHYIVTGIPVGIYTLQAMMNGYGRVSREGVRIISVCDTVRINFTLENGERVADANVIMAARPGFLSGPTRIQRITGEEMQRSSRTLIFGEP